jgi:NADPH-dependent 2,4-dienoyl-CoA reductase/sulfur reductase-like enzyme/nitrite reductase/ring-hydroxylating ferredoxin subunit
MALTPVATLDALPPGELKRVIVDGRTLLLARLADGTVTALDATCPHARASLAFGVLSHDRVVCPLHLAAFDARSGLPLAPPSCDGVAVFPVQIDGANVLVDASAPSAPHAAPAAPPATDPRTFVIVGAGPAGTSAAVTLRAQGFGGRVVLVGDEPVPAYERPELSKAFLLGLKAPEALAMLPAAAFDSLDLDLRLGVRATRLDAAARRVELSDGTTLAYDQALVATGATPRRPAAPLFDAPNVHVLRTLADARALQAALPATGRVLLLGAGFIGLELAATLRKKKLEVTVVAPEAVPFERILGPQVGGLFADLHRANGVDLRLGRTVARLEGGPSVTAAVLDDGARVEVDQVVLGLGVTPAAAFVQGAPTSEREGALLADATLRVADGLWAAGDLVRFPMGPEGASTRIEHWRVAQQMGRTAALGMLGRPEPFAALPFFWTHHYTLMFQLIGSTAGFDDVIFQGEPSPKGFLCYYLRQGRLVAVAAAQRAREVAAASECLRRGDVPDAATLRVGVDWPARLRSLAG